MSSLATVNMYTAVTLLWQEMLVGGHWHSLGSKFTFHVDVTINLGYNL